MAQFFYSTGRRKTASSRVFLREGTGAISINGKKLNEYFKTSKQQKMVNSPLQLTETEGKLDLNITVKGGGLSGQSEAVRHGLSRALTRYLPAHRSLLKKNGFLTRDSRSVERKKYGRHKARKSTHLFSKR